MTLIHQETNESVLILNLKNGQEQAFKLLYKTYSAKIFYFSLKYLHSKEESEGIVQEVFTRIWEKKSQLDPHKPFGALLFTITKNLIFNKHRKKLNERAYVEYLKEYLDEIYDKTENEILINDLKNIIDKYIAKLPPKRREIYLLSREEGLSYREIAEKMEISEKTVEAQMSHALKFLRNILNKESIYPLIFMISSFYT